MIKSLGIQKDTLGAPPVERYPDLIMRLATSLNFPPEVAGEIIMEVRRGKTCKQLVGPKRLEYSQVGVFGPLKVS